MQRACVPDARRSLRVAVVWPKTLCYTLCYTHKREKHNNNNIVSRIMSCCVGRTRRTRFAVVFVFAKTSPCARTPFFVRRIGESTHRVARFCDFGDFRSHRTPAAFCEQFFNLFFLSLSTSHVFPTEFRLDPWQLYYSEITL